MFQLTAHNWSIRQPVITPAPATSQQHHAIKNEECPLIWLGERISNEIDYARLERSSDTYHNELVCANGLEQRDTCEQYRGQFIQCSGDKTHLKQF